MEWIEQKDSVPQLPPEAAVDLWREAATIPNGSPEALFQLATALFNTGDTPGALEALKRYTDRTPGNAEAWRFRASLHFDLDEFAGALDAAERAGHAGMLFRARALIALGRADEGEQLLRGLLAEDTHSAVFERLARLLTRQGRGSDLLALCDARGRLPGCATIALAYRALALGLMGRDAEARRIVDPERHVKQVAFDPPVEQFNADLAAQILRGSQPAAREGLGIAYEPDRRRIPGLLPLYDFFRREMALYADELAERGLAEVMQPPPERVRLHNGVTVLRGKGQHGDHIHPRGYISCVYHVVVPEEISGARDLRGHLEIGGFEGLAQQSWATRYIRPCAGVLTIFPSHFFHNVVPTGIEAPRVSVAGDMEPVSP